MVREFCQKMKFWKTADRIGPDVPTTHWHLFFPSPMLKLCKRKFKYFADTAEVRPGAYIIACSNISLGERVIIRPGTVLHASPRPGEGVITIEDDVAIGHNVHIYTDNHNFDNPNVSIIDQGYQSKHVVLKRGCWIGANCTILAGVTIGENTVIGAGSIVTKSIPAKTVAAGNPAKVIRNLS